MAYRFSLSNNPDTFYGTPSSDIIYGRGGDDKIFGGYGSDWIFGGDDADRLFGDGGNDIIRGGEGDDYLYGGSGNDTLDGGAGADRLDGGSGFDTVTYATSESGVFVDVNYDQPFKGYDGDTYISIEGVIGSNYDDNIYGDYFEGKANVLYGLGGEDVLVCFEGNDRLYGGSDNDYLEGGAGIDRLYGGSDNDTLNGGVGADILDGGAGLDEAFYSGSDAGVTIDLAAGTASGGSADGDTLISIENLSGSSHDDTFFGDDADNIFEGRSGSDVLDGRDGNDILFGGIGDDILNGGDGNDVLTGGGGEDIFVFINDMNTQEFDLVTDFEVGIDTLDFSNDINLVDDFAELQDNSVQLGADVVIATGQGSITLQDTQLSDLTQDDFIFA